MIASALGREPSTAKASACAAF